MGIISIIGLAFSIIKVVWGLISDIRALEAAYPDFKSAPFLVKLKDAIAYYKQTGNMDRLMAVHQELQGVKNAASKG